MTDGEMAYRIKQIGLILLLLTVIFSGCTFPGFGGEDPSEGELYKKAALASDFRMLGRENLPEVKEAILKGGADWQQVILFESKSDAMKAVAEGKVGEKDVYAYAMEDTTAERIRRLNILIESKKLGARLEGYGLPDTITTGTLVTNPVELWDFLHDRTILSDQEYEYIIS